MDEHISIFWHFPMPQKFSIQLLRMLITLHTLPHLIEYLSAHNLRALQLNSWMFSNGMSLFESGSWGSLATCRAEHSSKWTFLEILDISLQSLMPITDCSNVFTKQKIWNLSRIFSKSVRPSINSYAGKNGKRVFTFHQLIWPSYPEES